MLTALTTSILSHLEYKTILSYRPGTVHCSCPNGHAFNVACPASLGLTSNQCCDKAEMTTGCSGSKIVTSNSRLESSTSSPRPSPSPSSHPDFNTAAASSAANAGEWNGLG